VEGAFCVVPSSIDESSSSFFSIFALNDGRKALLLEATAKWREKEVDEDEATPVPGNVAIPP